DEKKWQNYNLLNVIKGLGNSINSRLRNRMSQLSLGVFNVLENGPGRNLSVNEEICLFNAFGEIETTNKIIKGIILDNYSLVSPTLFHNSVHHTSLGYYTIIKSIHNSCVAISDGLSTNFSFINYIKMREQINSSFIIASGEEYSSFFELDQTMSLKIIPAFVSYRVTPLTEKGFCYAGVVNSLEDLKQLEIYKKALTIFADKETFFILKSDVDKRVITEYPIILDNPCGIIFRLAVPFYFKIKGLSLVIERVKNKIYYFEVNL
ncbi:MAG: hypothetical protein KAT05_11780, partial [Spirochaetes bacterium]|nr:hypothetical protein [Spirochaetota bacterium]